MANEYGNPMRTPPAEEKPTAQGGLASRTIGGLSQFMENVNKGLEAVQTNPLYAHLWSGLVSGRAGDPAAGPMALAQLRQSQFQEQAQEQDNQAREAYRGSTGFSTPDEHLNHLRIIQTEGSIAEAERQRKAREKMQRALSDSDPSNDMAALRAAYPEKYAIQQFAAPGQAGRPIQVLDPVTGKPKYVNPNDAIGMQPVPRAPLVQNNVGSGLTNSTTTKVQGKQLDAQDAIARLDSMRSSFRPEFQQWGTKLGQRWMALKESAGAGLSDAEKSQLTDMSSFQADAYENMSLILNQLSGAAISPAEFERLSRFLPNVGSGVFDGDSPTAFKAKLERFDKSVRQAIKRYEYAQKQGLQTGGFEIPLDQFGVPESVKSETSKPRPDGVPEGSRYDEAGRMWITPDGRVFLED